MKTNVTARTLLTDLGIGNFNATMIIPFMFMAPATTDPRQPSVMMLVRQIQSTLYSMGAQLDNTGLMDQPTAAALGQLMGPGWLNKSWAQVVSTLNDAKAANVNLTPAPAAVAEVHGSASPVSGVLDFLPDVPGGLLTYAVGAGALYYFLKKR